MTVNCGLLFGYEILRWDDDMVSALIVNKMRHQEAGRQQRKCEKWHRAAERWRAHQHGREGAFILQVPNLTWGSETALEITMKLVVAFLREDPQVL